MHLLCIASIAVLIAGPQLATAHPLAALSGHKLQLNSTNCPLDLRRDSAFECGSLTVPIDHDDHSVGTIDLFLARRQGGDGSLGNLFFNNGGPGEDSIMTFKMLVRGEKVFDGEVLDKYNIVAVDPRGTGRSSQIQCDTAIWSTRLLTRPTDEAGFAEVVRYNGAFGHSCLNLTGPLVNYMDSVSVARDFELLRRALGGGAFNYLGYSYGTLLGTTYAERHPKRIGRMILDSVVDHSVNGDIYQVMTSLETYQATLEQFFAWYEESEDFYIYDLDVKAMFRNITAHYAKHPVSHLGRGASNVMAGAQILIVIRNILMGGSSTWVKLARAITSANFGEPSAFFRMSLETTGTIHVDPMIFPNIATRCQDWPTSIRSADDLNRIDNIVSAQLPIFKDSDEGYTWQTDCLGWPAPRRNPPRALDPDQMAQVPPMMIVNSFWDPATSAVWAQSLGKQIPNAINIWRNGTGHISYNRAGGATRKAMTAFLVDGSLPKDGTVYGT